MTIDKNVSDPIDFNWNYFPPNVWIVLINISKKIVFKIVFKLQEMFILSMNSRIHRKTFNSERKLIDITSVLLKHWFDIS